MTNLATVKAVLEGDATLLTTATGGVWDFIELGRMGLNRSNSQASGAFDSVGQIKPCVVVKARTDLPFGEIADDPAQVVGMREMVECWFYADNSFAAINTLKDRVFTLLHGKQLAGTFVCRHAGDFGQAHDLELDAFTLRSDYALIYKRN
jgi:hypothetical protein